MKADGLGLRPRCKLQGGQYRPSRHCSLFRIAGAGVGHLQRSEACNPKLLIDPLWLQRPRRYDAHADERHSESSHCQIPWRMLGRHGCLDDEARGYLAGNVLQVLQPLRKHTIGRHIKAGRENREPSRHVWGSVQLAEQAALLSHDLLHHDGPPTQPRAQPARRHHELRHEPPDARPGAGGSLQRLGHAAEGRGAGEHGLC
mmetsp:Transcript_15228/g.43575  ORF Transcript_15228/g.43575 Transcript_15228/m.43575 type:complete len:201 (+) Transcript_15228:160-762(+)